MKKTLIVMLSIIAVLFGFASCDNSPARQYITDENIEDVAANGSGTYYLSDNITLTEQLNITAPITIDGDGYTITRDTTALTSATETTNAVILISSNDVILRNLSIDGAQNNSSAEWIDGVWGIKVFNATGVELENITVSNINAGIQVNSADVTVGGKIEVTECHWGGIGVDQSADNELRKGSLTLASSANIVSTNENKPAIWLESADKASIEGAGSMVNFKCTDEGKTSQVWYITEAQVGKAVDQRPSEEV